VKIRVSYPSEKPQINVDIDVSPIIKAVRETIKKLPFRIEWEKEKPKDGKH